MRVPAWTTSDPELGRVSVAPLQTGPDGSELALVHSWVGSERARYWEMAGASPQELAERYRELERRGTHHAWLVRIGDQPVGLLHTFSPQDHPVGRCYPVQPGDLGIQLLLAPADPPRPGFTGRLAGVVTPWIFADPAVRRLVVEPDARDQRALARLTRTGFTLGPVVQLPGKQAVLAFLDRERFEDRQPVASTPSTA
ncbi:GNAT family N-acetyltransferase [Auraticoccus sp. F435]|uniref:Lysine N-acyltransferase MbtK n=1 Tax=Auraticoccus cholistanensis TaxID=2656650 RepID=A0A6A9UYW9_9ACTN|nr:GNAT family N-acetyltransferase [Auraticoccus cholistanensis]MVA76877.1 GNAT family N-acetyltransferase [Auraticoccus cholistanensis]